MSEVRAILAHALVMGQNAYPSPEEFAEGILKRLDLEGYAIVQKIRLKDTVENLLHDAAAFDRAAVVEVSCCELCNSEVGKMDHRRNAAQFREIARRLRVQATEQAAL